MFLYSSLCLLALQATTVLGNTEKVIFLGPASFQVPNAHPTIEDLHLEALAPHRLSLRTHIKAQFPTNDAKYGPATWLVLDQLQEGRRYEVRVCWAATQPTSFRLDVFELSAVFSSPELVTSLAEYSASRQPDLASSEDQEPKVVQELQKPLGAEETKSILFLQILAAADYYTMNKTLMENVPPVYVDIILDPFLFNVFPQSLVPTAIYIIALAIGSWFLSKLISAWILRISQKDINSEKKKS